MPHTILQKKQRLGNQTTFSSSQSQWGTSSVANRYRKSHLIAEAKLLTSVAGGTWSTENIYLEGDKRFETQWLRPANIKGRTSVVLVNKHIQTHILYVLLHLADKKPTPQKGNEEPNLQFPLQKDFLDTHLRRVYQIYLLSQTSYMY